MGNFTNKTLMITSGTGSFGNAVFNRLKNGYWGNPHFFKRRKKQYDMRHEYQAKYPEYDIW